MIQVLPCRPVLIWFIILYKVTNFSKGYFLESSIINDNVTIALISVETLKHVSVGVVSIVIIFFNIYQYEKEFGQVLKSMVATKPSSNTSTSDKAKID